MNPIRKPYSEFQTAKYTRLHGKPKVAEKVLFWVVSYNGRGITRPQSYPACQVELKTFRMMGITYPNKELFKIIPS